MTHVHVGKKERRQYRKGFVGLDHGIGGGDGEFAKDFE